MDPGGIFSPRWGISKGPPAGWQPKAKMVAGLLAILLNGLGIHSFYLGNTKKGIIQLVLYITCIGAFPSMIWGIIDGIQILTDKETTDAYGVPLTQ